MTRKRFKQIGGVGDKITPEMLDAISRIGGGTKDFINTFERGKLPINVPSSTKFSSWVEPGAVPGSYREVFVTAPKSGDVTYKTKEQLQTGKMAMMLTPTFKIPSFVFATMTEK